MKTKLILLVILILPSFGAVGGGLHAQQPELLNNMWYVHSLTINGQTTVAPRDPEMTIEAFFSNNDMLNEMCCAGEIVLQLTYDAIQPTFEINSINTVIKNCTDVIFNNIRDIYIDFFQNNTNDDFAYNISTQTANFGNYKILEITNPAGDILLFHNSPHDLQADYYIFGDDQPFYRQWFLNYLIINGTPYPVSYDVAQQTAITFTRDGSFHSQLCGEIISKAAFVNDDGNGSFGTGEFYILCENLTFLSGNCQNTALTDVEQLYYNFLQNLANGNIATYKRSHADFSDFCSIIEIIEFYDPATNAYVSLVDCLEALSASSFNHQLITVYPNPVSETLYITFKNPSQVVTVNIYNINGKLIHLQTLKSQDKIDVKQLSNGVYFIVVENEAGIKQTEKFVKK